MGEVGEDPRWEIFGEFHDYLAEAFPLVFAKLSITKVNTHGLLIHWPGSDFTLKPYLFMGHQDVVPVPENTVDRWTYPPFSGHYDGRYIWSRGVNDCKNVLIGVLEAFEVLLEKGFQPQRTILAGFGFDEEISGYKGAAYISKYLEKEFGKDSIELIIDEGGLGIRDLYGAQFALPALGEKGYFDVRITVDTAGGHSSVPPDHTGIGILSRIITAIEDRPFTPQLTPVNPFFATLQCSAKYGPDMDHSLRKQIISSLSSKKSAQKVADTLASEDIGKRYLMQTSQATDLISGGVKINALPESVSAVVNHRIAVESSVDDIVEHVTSIIKSVILPNFPLALDSFGNITSPSTASIGNITLSSFELVPLSPAPVSPYTSSAYRILSGTIKKVYGNDTIVSPSLMTGNTDTKYFWDLTRDIYRFSPMRDTGRENIHTVDEKMGMKEHVEGVKFYAALVLGSDALPLGWSD